MPITSLSHSECSFGRVPLKDICRTPQYQKMTDFALNNITSAEQRLMVGITGVVMQPWLELKNKKVDEDTRILSACKNTAKALVGATTGFFIRKGCITLVDKLIAQGKLLPKNYTSIPNIEQKIKNYSGALGTALAILVMCFTNFAIDAPMTQWLTGKFYEKTTGKEMR